MKKKFKFTTFGIFAAGLSLLPFFASAQTQTDYYSVLDVLDSNTIRVLVNGETKKVHLIGLNSPTGTKCYASKAKARLKLLTKGNSVKLTEDGTQGDADKNGVLQRYVYLIDGRMLNELMIRDGYGLTAKPKKAYAKLSIFKKKEAQAAAAKRGLWAAATCNGKF